MQSRVCRLPVRSYVKKYRTPHWLSSRLDDSWTTCSKGEKSARSNVWGKQTCNKQTLVFSFSSECTEFIEFTQSPLPASCYRKITSQKLEIYHCEHIYAFSFISTHLSGPKQSQKSRRAAVLCFSLSHSSSMMLLLSPFLPFSFLLPPSADNVNNRPLTAYVSLLYSFQPLLLTQFSNQTLLARIPTRGLCRGTQAPFNHVMPSDCANWLSARPS